MLAALLERASNGYTLLYLEGLAKSLIRLMTSDLCWIPLDSSTLPQQMFLFDLRCLGVARNATMSYLAKFLFFYSFLRCSYS
jgi:hypothetical protein